MQWGPWFLCLLFMLFPTSNNPSVWQLSLFTAKRHGWVNISDFFFYQLTSRFLKCFFYSFNTLPCKLLGRCPKWSTSSRSYLMGTRMTWVSKTRPLPSSLASISSTWSPHTPPHTLRVSTENMEIAVWHVLSYFVTDTLFLTNGSGLSEKKKGVILISHCHPKSVV